VERNTLTLKLGVFKETLVRIKNKKEIAGGGGAYKRITKRWGEGC
jgi:hypothetical protein